tara:strand:+ start:8628 stop:8960 length:333 start_codon:yes stop_codon:yes gene_type:complete
MEDKKQIWLEIKIEDNCLWKPKGKVYKNKPTLEEMQESVGGLIQYMPEIYLMEDVTDMIVNEEGLLLGLKDNHLANMQLQFGAPRVVGDVLVKVDEGFITKEFWTEGEEE